MVAGNWNNKDGLYLQYGTTKAVPETAGDYKTYGASRVLECQIDLTTLTSTAAIQSNTTFFPTGANIHIEKVEVIALVGAASGTSFSVGLMKTDRSTTMSDTAFVAAMTQAVMANAGDTQVLTKDSTAAGGYIGATAGAYVGNYENASPSNVGYISAKSSGTFTTGLVKVRIHYVGVGTIPN